MLEKSIAELMNAQINTEFYSAYLYLFSADYYHEEGLDGFANWYDVQAQEERDHAMLMRTCMNSNGERVTLEAIAKPDSVINGMDGPLKAALSFFLLFAAESSIGFLYIGGIENESGL